MGKAPCTGSGTPKYIYAVLPNGDIEGYWAPDKGDIASAREAKKQGVHSYKTKVVLEEFVE